MSALGLEQFLAEIYANEIAQGQNLTAASDNPFVRGWKSQWGGYGYNPVVGVGDPFAPINYEPTLEYGGDWWDRQEVKPYPEADNKPGDDHVFKPIPDPEDESKPEEEKKPLPEPGNKDFFGEPGEGGGGEGGGGQSFTDMRDPAFVGRDAFPGMKDGQWVGGNMSWGSVSEMLGKMRGGGFISNMLGTSMSTFNSKGGQEAITAISGQLGLDPNSVNSAIAQALGFGAAPGSQKGTGGILGALGINMGGATTASGAPNVFGMMFGDLPTWENLTFNNIVNERDTVSGVMQAMANPNNFDWGQWGPINGSWVDSQPYMITEFGRQMANLGLNINNQLPDLQVAAVQSFIDYNKTKPNTVTVYSWVNDVTRSLQGPGSTLMGQIARGEPVSNAADAGRLAGYATSGYMDSMRDWAAGKMSTDVFAGVHAQYESNKTAYQNGSYASGGDGGGYGFSASGSFGGGGGASGSTSFGGSGGASGSTSLGGANFGGGGGGEGGGGGGEGGGSSGGGGYGDTGNAGSQTGPGGASEGASRDGR